MKLFYLALILVQAGFTASSFADCQTSFDPNQVQINWTAYKMTEHVPVHASFKVFTITGPTSGSDIPTILNGLKADLASDSVATGNPIRDTNIVNGFFKTVHGFSFRGSFRNARGGNTDGSLELLLTMNQRTRIVPMTYTVAADGTFTAVGTLDVLDFALGDALTKMNQTCADYHTGADGVSKTWSTVDLTFVVPTTTTCATP
jgi:hypothetical protein